MRTIGFWIEGFQRGKIFDLNAKVVVGFDGEILRLGENWDLR